LLEEGRWRFAQFGGLAIATNGTDPMVKIDLTTDTVASLGGTPPKFETLAVVKDFLVGGVRNSQIMHLGWSGINDAEWWTVGQRQADLNILPDGGRINGILSGEYGIILQRNCIRRMDYVGGNIIFEFNVVSTNVGCVTPHSVAQWGRIAFFLSDNGFMMWDGSQAVPIGQEKIDRSFASQYDVTDWPSMSTAIDPVNRVVMWSMADKIWCYHWDFGKWTVIPIVSSIIFSGVTKAVSIDEDYPPDMPDDTDIDGAGLPTLDDPVVQGRRAAALCIQFIAGVGRILTAHRWPQSSPALIWKCSGQRACLRMARPDCDAVDKQFDANAAGQAALGDAGSSTAFNSLTTSGDMPLRFSARFIRPTFQIAAGTTWSYAKGMTYVGEPGAGR
jgi:hypothetical protein